MLHYIASVFLLTGIRLRDTVEQMLHKELTCTDANERVKSLQRWVRIATLTARRSAERPICRRSFRAPSFMILKVAYWRSTCKNNLHCISCQNRKNKPNAVKGHFVYYFREIFISLYLLTLHKKTVGVCHFNGEHISGALDLIV